MSRRQGRESESKRHRSRFDRDPSPKRYRREDERRNVKPPNKTQFDKDGDENRKLRHSILDPKAPFLPFPETETETGAVDKKAEKKDDGHHNLAKHTADPSKVGSRSYLQHDDRGGLGQTGRSIGRRSDRDFGSLRYSKEHQNDRAETYSRQRNELYEFNKKDDRVWRHDGYFEMEGNPKPLVSKRPSVREHKIQSENRNVSDKIGADPLARNPQVGYSEAGRKDQRWHSSDRSFRPERSFARDTEFNRSEQWGDRDSGTRFRGRESFPLRQGNRPGGGFVEKWKHDLYEKTNESTSPKNEEDQISKIEALLAS